ncbi:uncharacterized protein LOC126981914 isoform X2 [Eriocheir sinensis]|uniref:uncharacterized protein LOC126981914 isoform X2 n=1 Tax=Eriocheir sinensis TaxID=95602 RepID=UPI0021CA2CD6|nr:uncharacterized protein LOC126981914 isoform X2 [Eriocheir sinensis]
MTGRLVMNVVVLGLVFCSVAEGYSSITRGSGDSDDSGDGGGVYLRPNARNTPNYDRFNSSTVNTTTFRTIASPVTLARVHCEWKIFNPRRHKLVLRFTKLNLKHCQGAFPQCCFQWLELTLNATGTKGRDYNTMALTPHHTTGLSSSGGGGGSVLGVGRVCGSSLPRPVVTEAPQVYVTFHSLPHDGLGNYRSEDNGFVLEFYSVKNITWCGRYEFQCHSPRLCLPLEWLCDGKVQCPDHSDEHYCISDLPLHREQQLVKKMLKKKRKMKKQQQLKETEKKDERKNVAVQSELGREGRRRRRRRKRSLCLQEATTIQCDGVWQCPDGEDEKGCQGCGPDEWWCGVGRECYGPKQRCDGTWHCSNAMDEPSCDSNCPRRISCWGWGCYLLSQRCDGTPDCRDGSDEEACPPELCNDQHGTFLCDNQQCIKESCLCDQNDDCRDGSDEQNCLRNSVIGVAAMGGLACSLLLVVAVGCTGRLYALRMGLTRLQGSGSRGRGGSGVRGGVGGGGGPSSSSHAPRSRLEEHLMQREMPPPYDVAVSDHSNTLFGSFMDWQQWRRQRHRPLVPRDSANHPLRVPADPHHPQFHQHSTSSSVPGLAVEIQPARGREGEEKVEERGAGEENVASTNAFVFAMHEDDVPLLTDLGGGEGEGEVGDDVPLLLDITSTTTTSSTSTSTCEEDSDQEEEDIGSDDVDEEEEEDDEEEGRKEEEEEGEDKGVGKAITHPLLLPDLIHLTPQPLHSPSTHTQEKGEGGEGTEVGRRERENTPSSAPPTSPFTPNTEMNAEKEERNQTNTSSPSSSPSFPSEDAAGEGGGGGGGADVLSADTRAAVLALSAVQSHMNEMSHSDTEMMSQ